MNAIGFDITDFKSEETEKENLYIYNLYIQKKKFNKYINTT